MPSTLVYVTLDGAEEVCPICGEKIKLSWEMLNRVSFTSRLKSHPSEADHSCPHFQGAYETGTLGTVEMMFR